MINLIYTILCIACLCMGFFVGYRMPRESKSVNNVPLTNPIKAVKKKIEDKKAQEEIQEQLEELNKIYQNIENYDGTENNQKELKNIEIKL